MEYDRSKLDWVDHPEKIFVIHDKELLLDGDIHFASSTRQGAEAAIATRKMESVAVKEITLHRPSLRAVYGGPTLIEALWAEMDSIMERLMTGQASEDGGDKYRAQELAWVLAIVTNAYDPSVDRIRKEAMARWERQQAEEAGYDSEYAEPQS